MNRRLFTFLICLLLSSFFWLTMSLSKEYTITLAFPVKYTNLPKDKILSSNISKSVELDIKSKGFNLLLNKLKQQKDTLLIDIKDCKPSGFKNHYYLNTNFKIEKITKQFSNDIKVLKINPDTIFIDFTKKVTKRVPVRSKILIDFDTQYQLKDSIECMPTFINISGSLEDIEKINFVETVPVSLTKVNKFTKFTLSILQTSNLKMLEINPSSVEIKIKVSKFTEGNLELPIEITNLPKGYNLKTFPDKIQVKYNIAYADFEKIHSNQFRAVVDYKKIESGSNKLKINLIKSPQGISNIKLSDEKVEFIIRK